MNHSYPTPRAIRHSRLRELARRSLMDNTIRDALDSGNDVSIQFTKFGDKEIAKVEIKGKKKLNTGETDGSDVTPSTPTRRQCICHFRAHKCTCGAR